MRRRKPKEPVDVDGRLSKQLLSLSLFIVLLAFFIVLNGVSSFDEGKVRDTITSVGFAFGTNIEVGSGAEGELTSQKDHLDEAANKGTVFDRMEALFEANIPGHKAVLSKSQGILHIALPLDEFEQAVEKTLQAGGRIQDDEMSEYLLATLIALMDRDDDDDIQYRMDIVYNLPSSPAGMMNDKPQEFSAHLRRSSQLAGNIEQMGLPEKLMSMSMSKGNSAIVDLYFSIHETHKVDVDGSGSN